MSPANAPRPCPYCDHVSPPDSKFCNECGAALHLQPCPHCGAVNDITKSNVCGRCQGDLHGSPDTQPASEPPILKDELALPTASGSPLVPAASTPSFNPSPYELGAERRSPVLTVGLLTLAVGAAAYFGYQAWQSPAANPASSSAAPAPDTQAPAPSPASAPPPPMALPTQAPSAGPPAADIAPDTKPLTPPADNTEATGNAADAASNSGPVANPAAPLSKVSPRPQAKLAPAAQASGESSAPASPPVSSRQRSEAQQGLDLKPPQISNCTEATAALGLCVQDTKPRSP
ncbi:double zinc ribbon domain-containing protein [Roseateles sp.]|uniref:double zinc ribbon domain-containing protein n=1 Tax=Roseateles sp. TaxID=1971397 RepID=UPI003BA5FBE2